MLQEEHRCSLERSILNAVVNVARHKIYATAASAFAARIGVRCHCHQDITASARNWRQKKAR